MRAIWSVVSAGKMSSRRPVTSSGKGADGVGVGGGVLIEAILSLVPPSCPPALSCRAIVRDPEIGGLRAALPFSRLPPLPVTGEGWGEGLPPHP